MMGIGPSDAGRLSMYEFTGLVHHWNARQDPKGESEALEHPNDDAIRARWADLEARGIGRVVH